MLRRSVSVVFALWVCLFAGSTATACSPVRGARILTNLELVEKAPTIVIGRVLRWDRKQSPGTAWFKSSSIVVQPVKALKGNGPGRPFRLDGMLAMRDGLATAADSQPSDFGEFQQPHPNAYAGGCIRSNFVVGQLVLFFLQFERGEWQPSTDIFARWAEDVPGIEGPWVRLVQIYIEASRLPPAKRGAYLRRQKGVLLAGKPDRIKRRMAADIQRQIDGKRQSLGI